MSPSCVSLRHLSRSVLLLRPAVFSLDRSSSLSSVSIGPPSPFRSQFLDEADLPPALPEGVLRFYGSSPRLFHPSEHFCPWWSSQATQQRFVWSS
ncbi:hypothetical protein Bca101_098334 [Brassica carinata]